MTETCRPAGVESVLLFVSEAELQSIEEMQCVDVALPKYTSFHFITWQSRYHPPEAQT